MRNWLKLLYVRYRRDVRVERHVVMDSRSCCSGHNLISEGCRLFNSSLGTGSYLGRNCRICNTSVGNYSSIGEGVKLGFGLHPTSEFVSTYPAFFDGSHPATIAFTAYHRTPKIFREHRFIDEANEVTNIVGSDVWLGDDVKALDGVRIGDGAIVGTGSIVTRDCVPYGIYVGAPARLVRMRFTASEIAFLLALKWWERDFAWISRHAALFGDVKQLMAGVKLDDRVS